jgi:hypothetical protein
MPTTTLTDTSSQEFTTLNALNRALATGQDVLIVTDGEVERIVKFPVTPTSSYTKHVFVHGSYPCNIESLLDYVKADAHSRSKVQWFDGARFHSWF